MKKIELFVPYYYKESPLSIKTIENSFGKKVFFVSKGRYAIIHILKSYGLLNGKIGISAYMCPSVQRTLEKSGYSVVYYDIDTRDLNPDVYSIENLIKEEKPRAIVVPSMYGNPANLFEIEALCKAYNVLMIDDAAQSYGAVLEGKTVGSFGDGGFFSFSPGKPTAAHRGGFFWTNHDYVINRTNNLISAYASYKDFLYRRYYAYRNYPIRRNLWHLINLCLLKTSINIECDRLHGFEEKVLGGVLEANANQAFLYRQKWAGVFETIESIDGCYFIKTIQKNSLNNRCKIVCIFTNKSLKVEFDKYLSSYSITHYGGYSVPEKALKCENARKINGMIVELPIDPNEDKMVYLLEHVNSFMNKHR